MNIHYHLKRSKMGTLGTKRKLEDFFDLENTNHDTNFNLQLYFITFSKSCVITLNGVFSKDTDLHCRKAESTKWLKHKLRATIGDQ